MRTPLMTLALLALAACSDPDASDFAKACDAATSADSASECMREGFVDAQDRLDACARDLGAREEDVDAQREIEREESRDETRDETRDEDTRDTRDDATRDSDRGRTDSRDVDVDEVTREHERTSRDLRDLRDRTEDELRRHEGTRRRAAVRDGLRGAWEMSDCERVADASRR